MIEKVNRLPNQFPIALAALERAAKQAADLARQTMTPAWIMEGEKMVDVTKTVPPESKPSDHKIS